MEDQVQNSVVEQNVGQTTREGLDVSMPDVELASDIPSVQDGVIDEGNRRAPNLITKEGDESDVSLPQTGKVRLGSFSLCMINKRLIMKNFRVIIRIFNRCLNYNKFSNRDLMLLRQYVIN